MMGRLYELIEKEKVEFENYVSTLRLDFDCEMERAKIELDYRIRSLRSRYDRPRGSGRRTHMKCYECGKRGHLSANCWRKHHSGSSADLNWRKDSSSAHSSGYESESDSGISNVNNYHINDDVWRELESVFDTDNDLDYENIENIFENTNSNDGHSEFETIDIENHDYMRDTEQSVSYEKYNEDEITDDYIYDLIMHCEDEESKWEKSNGLFENTGDGDCHTFTYEVENPENNNEQIDDKYTENGDLNYDFHIEQNACSEDVRHEDENMFDMDNPTTLDSFEYVTRDYLYYWFSDPCDRAGSLLYVSPERIKNDYDTFISIPCDNESTRYWRMDDYRQYLRKIICFESLKDFMDKVPII